VGSPYTTFTFPQGGFVEAEQPEAVDAEPAWSKRRVEWSMKRIRDEISFLTERRDYHFEKVLKLEKEAKEWKEILEWLRSMDAKV
jgi:hypothetical protein